jgi:DNA-binding beta-propeller fold protein YncE
MTRNYDPRPTRIGWLKAGCLRAVCTVGLLGGVMAPGASAATGDLLQRPRASGCFSNIGFCLPATALSAAQGVTVSPDGQNVYIAARESDAVAVFDRDSDGTLVQKPGSAGCISDAEAGRCVDGSALDGASSVTVSPDGDSAYVTAALSDSIAVFDRTQNGRLVQKSGRAGCISNTGSSPCADGRRLDGPTSVTVSPDGESVYVAAEFSDAIVIFDRAPNGKLTQKAGEAGCISDSGDGSCADGRVLFSPTSIALSPDGENAYVTAADRSVAVFDRASDGTLNQKRGAAGCVHDLGTNSCANGTALQESDSVTVSPDGESVYVASSAGDGGVAVFDRAPKGKITQKPGASGCINADGSALCTNGSAINGAISVAVSPDGQSVYVASYKGAVAIFNRAPNGTLAQKPNPKGCIRETASSACADGSALLGANSITVSPDGQSVYVASDASDALALFDREPSPSTPRRSERARKSDHSSAVWESLSGGRWTPMQAS